MKNVPITLAALLALTGCGSDPGSLGPPGPPPAYPPVPAQPLANPAAADQPSSSQAAGRGNPTDLTPGGAGTGAGAVSGSASGSIGAGLAPPPVLAATGSLDDGWDDLGVGTVPSDWRDVRADGYDYPWLYAGQWAIASIGGFKAFEQSLQRQQPALSFRRYSGTAFGTPDGELPLRYRAEVWLAAYGSPSYPPTGDQGVPLYYLDPTHYVEVLIKPHSFEAWQCDGGQPENGAGWQRLYTSPLETASGQQRQLGMIVDGSAGTAQLLLGGKVQATVTSRLIRPVTHFMALRSAGNTVAYFEVKAAAL